MGYRASVITQHREYGSNIFYNWDEFQIYRDFLNKTYSKDYDCIYQNENEDYYEIPKTIFEQEIKRLEDLPPDDMTDTYFIQSLRDALKEAPDNDDFVSLEWF